MNILATEQLLEQLCPRQTGKSGSNCYNYQERAAGMITGPPIGEIDFRSVREWLGSYWLKMMR